MPPCDPFHTSETEEPPVYHNNSACPAGQAIKSWHRVKGKGTNRRLCEKCADLNAKGE